jgi:hypothetical protein
MTVRFWTADTARRAYSIRNRIVLLYIDTRSILGPLVCSQSNHFGAISIICGGCVP